MKISDLKIGSDKVDIEVNVDDIDEPRSFNKFGRDIRVATATISDDTGSVKLSLWNQDVDKVKAGDKIKITNGFVKEFQGEKQLTSGKFGKIEVLGEAEAKEEKKAGKKGKAKAEEEKAESEEESAEDEEESAEDF